MEKTSWLEKVTDEEVLRRVNKEWENIELYVAQEISIYWSHFETWRVHDLLREITEGRMKGKPTRGRRIQMLHDLVNDDGFVALKRAAEDREGWRHRERMSNTYSELSTSEAATAK